MYTELDYGVGAIVSALKARGMWGESLLAFASDK
jgi:arylsulfatase A-like enzyme